MMRWDTDYDRRLVLRGEPLRCTVTLRGGTSTTAWSMQVGVLPPEQWSLVMEYTAKVSSLQSLEKM